MLFSRGISAFRQCLQHKLLTTNTFCFVELQGNFKKSMYEYKQTRNYKNFGHTRGKYRFRRDLPFIICITGVAMSFFNWERIFKLLVPKVDAASILAEETQNDEAVKNIEHDLQKKKKNKKQKIGFRDRKV